MNAREERLLTPQTIAAVDHWLDEADVFAKGYWQYVDGKLTTVGLRIGQDWDKVVAFFGDTVVRHEDGSHSVLSAKDAAELARLRAERHSTNEALSDAVEQLRVLQARLNAVAEYATSRVTGQEANNEASASWVLHLLAVDHDSQDPIRPCGCPKRFDRHAWGCPTLPVEDDLKCSACGDTKVKYKKRLFCPTCIKSTHAVRIPQQRQAEDPHDGPLATRYATPHDLPFIPQQVTGRCPKGHTFEDCTCGGTQ